MGFLNIASLLLITREGGGRKREIQRETDTDREGMSYMVTE